MRNRLLAASLAAALFQGLFVLAPGVTTAGEEKHRVSSGESLTAIAGKFYGDEDLFLILALYNGKTDPKKISVGEVLKLPFSDTVTLRKGESLAVLSRRLWGDSDLYPILAEFNSIRKPESVPAGARLKVPILVPCTLARGENLAALAERFYGDNKRFTLIALASGIKDPARVAAGAVLKVPMVLTRAPEPAITAPRAATAVPAKKAAPLSPETKSPGLTPPPAGEAPSSRGKDPSAASAAAEQPGAAAAPTPSPSPPPVLSEAEGLYRSGQYAAARKLLLDASGSLQGADRAAALRVLALCHYAFEDRAAALRSLRQSVELDPGFVPQPSVYNPDVMRIYQEAKKQP